VEARPPVNHDSLVVPAGEAQASFEAIGALRRITLGDPEVRVAILDGPVDLSHPCFKGGALRRLPTLVEDPAGAGPMSTHGTHVTSVIFGAPDSPVTGIAPRCRGLILPIFRDGQGGHVSQLDLARAIEQAVEAGAQIINISGGQLAEGGEAELTLARAIKLCDDNNVLVVAAAGNDGCDCLHVPAGLPSSLAVGGMTADARPLESGNWGEIYQSNGVLAPGERIPGAVPGGSVGTMTGSSFATPIVSGVAALLMAIQRQRGETVSTRAVRGAILDSALPCYPRDAPECARFLAGRLNVTGALALITRGGTNTMSDSDPTIGQHAQEIVPQGTPMLVGGVAPSAVPESNQPGGPPAGASGLESGAIPATSGAIPPTSYAPPTPDPSAGQMAPQQLAAQMPVSHPLNPPVMAPGPYVVALGAQPMQLGPQGVPAGVQPMQLNPQGVPAGVQTMQVIPQAAPPAGQPMQAVSASAVATPTTTEGSTTAPGVSAGVAPSAGCGCQSGPTANVYALGNIGFDFGTEARRDSFRINMPDVPRGGSPPVFSAPNVYDPIQLADYLDANNYESTRLIWTLLLDATPIYAIEAETEYPEAVYRALRDALRFQNLPADDANYVSRVSIPGYLTGRTRRLFSGQVVPVVEALPTALYSWNEQVLVNEVVRVVEQNQKEADSSFVRRTVSNFLDKVYYQMRNLGQTSQDRALNYAATNVFTLTNDLSQGILSGQTIPTQGVPNLYTLDSITVSKSPFCRMDSDCQDVQVTFFDPENDTRARSVYQMTIDVSDVVPVQIAPTHQFLMAL
jgi:hypothetical protein